MNTVTPLTSALDQRVRQAMAAALAVEAAAADPQIRASDHADFQANGVLSLAKSLKAYPRELAMKVAAGLADDDLIADCEVSGPGFLNLTIADQAIWKQLDSRRGDARLGIPATDTGTVTVIDYSQPNIAKEMHVGHLRSTVIGDALVRILEFDAAKVIRHNHIGDWGTQFGMLIQFMQEEPEGQLAVGQGESGEEAISRLDALYRASRKKFDSDPEFADRARKRVVALQAGDPETVAGWQDIVAESKIYFEAVYERLGVLLTDEDAIGESFYNPFLQEVCADLEERGIAVRSDGALCVFFDDILGPDGTPAPLIVQKLRLRCHRPGRDPLPGRNPARQAHLVRGRRPAGPALPHGLRDGAPGWIPDGRRRGPAPRVRHGPGQGRPPVQDPRGRHHQAHIAARRGRRPGTRDGRGEEPGARCGHTRAEISRGRHRRGQVRRPVDRTDQGLRLRP
jgi:hypothetical protein